jgi:cytochrome c biogenesis protein CcmG, thiol:disulfide interchange protein DsbE
MRHLSGLAFAATLVLSLSARAEVKPGQAAPDFDGATLSQQPLKLSSLRGKVVLLDFWASWCEPCKKELPLLSQLAPRLRQKGSEIVAVNIDDDKKNAEDFVRAKGIRLTVVSDGSKKIVGRWEPPKMPSSFVIDKSGVVRAINGGFEPGDESKLEAQLMALVAK